MFHKITSKKKKKKVLPPLDGTNFAQWLQAHVLNVFITIKYQIGKGEGYNKGLIHPPHPIIFMESKMLFL